MSEPGPQVDPNAGNPPAAAGSAAGVVTSPDWREALPQELRGEKSLASFKDVGTLAKSYVEAQKLVGGSIRIPGADAKPEEWGAVYDKLGRPSKPEGYEFKVPESLEPEFSDSLRGGFAKVLHDNGVSAKAAQAILDWYGASYADAAASLHSAAQATEAELRLKWAGAYEKHMGLAKRTVKEMGGEELQVYLEQTGLGNHPALIRTFAKIGALLAEDGVIANFDGEVPSEQDAKTKIATIMNDKDHPYHDRRKAGHREAVEEMMKLHDLAYAPA